MVLDDPESAGISSLPHSSIRPRSSFVCCKSLKNGTKLWGMGEGGVVRHWAGRGNVARGLVPRWGRGVVWQNPTCELAA